MLNRRQVLIGGGAGALVLATGMAGQLLAAQPSPAAAVVAGPLAAAPAPFVALAAELSGNIGLDAVLVNRIYDTLARLEPRFDAKVAALAAALVKLPPRAAGGKQAVGTVESLDAEQAGLGALFLRLMSAVYLGTVDVAPKQRQCIAFETVASYQVVSGWVQPPSYCTGEPNFWTAPPVIATATPQGNAHV